MRARNQSLDALRGAAILLVLGNHFPCYPLWETVGWSGVYLFFVLSGFLVSGLLFDSYLKTGELQARRFIIRRGFKIWPAFYAYLIPVVVLSLFSAAPFPGRLLRDVALFISNYTTGDYITFTRHTWSLCVEEHFYLLLPLVFWICRRRISAIGWICLASLPLCLGFRALQVHSGIIAPPYTHVLMDSLFCGVGLAYLRRFKPAAFRLLASNWSIPLVLVLLAPIVLLDAHSNFMRTVGLTCSALGFSLVLAWSIDRWPSTAAVSKPLAILAKVGFYSYGIYLWHMVAQVTVMATAGKSTVSFWIYVAFAIALGVVMSQNVEQPFLEIRDRCLPRRCHK